MSSGGAGDRPRRPHTGRRRNAAARDAILDVTFDLLGTGGVADLTIDAIAEAAGVGRQTIYRWWPSKGAVVAEAMTRRARVIVPARDTGSLAADLAGFLADSFAGLQDPTTARALRQLAAVAQQDEHVAGVLAAFTAQRRAALRALLGRARASGDISPGADLDMLVDMAYGVLWYRLLIGHAPLDEDAARRLAASLIAAAGGGAAGGAGGGAGGGAYAGAGYEGVRAMSPEGRHDQSPEERQSPEDRYEDVVDALIGTDGVTPPRGGSGFGRSTLRLNGKIFAMLVRGRLVVKIPASRVGELVADGEGARFDANKGTPMKEWFSLDPGSGLEWLPLAREALDYAQRQS